MEERPIYITQSDLERLQKLVIERRAREGSSKHLRDLEDELQKAVVVDATLVPADVVTMHSKVELFDLDSGSADVCTLVFPEESDVEQAKVSVLAPIGTAILGYRVGDTFEWQVPAGTRRLQIAKILYQPEAAGDWHL